MKRNARQRVYDYLWDRLVQGQLGPGQPVLAQEIGEALQVSHIPVREAMFQLCAEGLLERTPRRGMVVSVPSRAEVVQLLDLRAAIEIWAAEVAAERITSARLHDLEQLIDALRRVVEQAEGGNTSARELTPQWGLIDMMFHRVLLRASGNDEALKVVERGVIRMLGFTVPYAEGWAGLPEQLRLDYEVHARVVAALAKHDVAEARQAMQAHAERARRNLIDRFEWHLRSKDSERGSGVPRCEWLRRLIREIEEQNRLEAGPASRERFPLDASLERLWRIEGASTRAPKTTKGKSAKVKKS